jgi:hypothetical protein
VAAVLHLADLTAGPALLLCLQQGPLVKLHHAHQNLLQPSSLGSLEAAQNQPPFPWSCHIWADHISC